VWDTQTYPQAPDVDRVSSGNLRIGIEDITPIAVHLGKQTRGYNVYSFPKSGTIEDSQLLAKWRRGLYQQEGEYRDVWSGVITKSTIEDNGGDDVLIMKIDPSQW
jgi:hypothetical protein